MINWKKAAKQYREVATTAMRWFREEQDFSIHKSEVVVAAQTYVNLLTTPRNPFVRLVTGEDINIQKAQENLIKAVSDFDKVIQTYSQRNEENQSLKQLDNVSSV